jgi:hypothetical protein
MWLSSQFSSVVGYDTDDSHWHAAAGQGVNLQVGDIRNPQGSADLIYIGHVLESHKWKSDFTNRPAVVEELRGRCRYLLLQVHRDIRLAERVRA